MRTHFYAIALFSLLAACAPTGSPPAPCADPTAGCAITLAGQSYPVFFTERPGVLRPFTVQVTAPQAKRVAVKLSMQGMDMGENRTALEPTLAGHWLGQVTLPVCVSGRSDWVLRLEVDGREGAMGFVVEK
jgi:hypothetical protein